MVLALGVLVVISGDLDFLVLALVQGLDLVLALALVQDLDLVQDVGFGNGLRFS